MYLSSMPPESRTSAVIGVRYSPRKLARSSGFIVSANAEKLRMSENRTVRSLRSPPSLAGAVHEVAAEEVLGERRVELDAVRDRIVGNFDLVERRVREADEHQLARECGARRGAGEHVGGGHAWNLAAAEHVERDRRVVAD